MRKSESKNSFAEVRVLLELWELGFFFFNFYLVVLSNLQDFFLHPLFFYFLF